MKLHQANPSVTYSGRKASQVLEELDAFVALMKAEGVQSYGEVGARHGDTFHYVVSALKCRGVALDLPGALWGVGSSREALNRAVQDLQASGLDASCLFGDSRTPATQRLFSGRGPYDAILIDGDHSYEGVLADWEAYRPMAKLVAFHDIVGDGQFDRPTRTPVQVPRLWSEIKQSYKTAEFIAAGSTMGVGVVWMM